MPLYDVVTEHLLPNGSFAENVKENRKYLGIIGHQPAQDSLTAHKLGWDTWEGIFEPDTCAKKAFKFDPLAKFSGGTND